MRGGFFPPLFFFFFSLNKRVSEELVYSQIATSVNDHPSLVLPVTQMAVEIMDEPKI